MHSPTLSQGPGQRPTRLAATLRRALGRLRRREPRFLGAYPDHAAALAAVPPGSRAGYDHAEIAEVSFEAMCRLTLWDYPVMLWLRDAWKPGLSVIDAGGHLGTKYIAFAPHLPMAEADWCVLDLPAIVAAAQARQASGALPRAPRFVSDPAQAGAADVFLASGLLQYLDVPLASLLGRLNAPPRRLILNKVATREGATVVTLEKIGSARVPYQIRDRQAFEAELAALPGYRLRDQWEIAGLSHVIGTHPGLGASASRGYVLDLVA